MKRNAKMFGSMVLTGMLVVVLAMCLVVPNISKVRAANQQRSMSDASVKMLMALLNQAKMKEHLTGLVPRPQVVKWHKGNFVLDANTKIYAVGKVAETEAQTFADMVRPALGFDMQILQGRAEQALAVNVPDNAIVMVITNKPARTDFYNNKITAEGYILKVMPRAVVVKAKAAAGLFYGLQTLRQLMPVQIYGKTVNKTVKWQAPCVEIADWPRFKWRGMMLDVSRHFFPATYIKRYLDLLAEHKVNVFHWHLTDDDGWRIEIKAYPRLTSIGAWRGPNEVLPPSRGSGNQRYGGFYTQQQIRDIVKYAAKLHINIMPELDMPGHCRAIAAAYPQTLPDTDLPAKPDKHKKKKPGTNQKPQIPNAISPAKESNYKMIDTIFKEVAGLFPFGYVHIGGDEVNYRLWSRSKRIEMMMKQKHLKNMRQVQGYFTLRLNGILRKYGKKMVGWNEILGGGKLPKDTTVMSWTGVKPGISAAKRGYHVIMSPGPYTYFDMKYPGPGERGHWWAGRISTQKVYSFDPIGITNLPPVARQNIVGVEACLWSEFVENRQRIEYQTFPRLCALCEVEWTAQKRRSWDNFRTRMMKELYRLSVQDVLFRVPPPIATVKDSMVTIQPAYPGLMVRYTLDGSQPVANSMLYKGPFRCNDARKLRMATFINQRSSKIVTGPAKTKKKAKKKTE